MTIALEAVLRDLDKFRAAGGGGKWENRPERLMLLQKLCDHTVFQMKRKKNSPG